ncbi:MAG: glycoside hydrolase family 28 protein [Chitinophagaceae bacterium]
MKLKLPYFFIIISIVLCMRSGAQDINILHCGAKGDGRFNNTSIIQKAIDELAGSGGGKLIMPKGTFVSGTIVLRSNVHLVLEEGAVLQGSDQRKDYGNTPQLALLYAKNIHHFSITGKGTIDGNGRALIKDIYRQLEAGTITDPDWKTKRPTEKNRASLFYFEACSGITVRDLILKDASTWVTHYEKCRDIIIDNIDLESTAYWNNDGIDIVDCRNVRITNAKINSADDGICLKSTDPSSYCDSVFVENCSIRSSANAFKLGTSSAGGFRNITVRNLKVKDTYRCAIALESVEGGLLENIDIRGVEGINTGGAIFVRLGHRNKDERYSVVRNIYIADVSVEVPAGKPDLGYEMEGPLLRYPPGIIPEKEKIISVSPWNFSYPDPLAVPYKHNVFPSSITGLPGHQVENVTLEHVTITYAGGGDPSVNFMPADSMHIITEAAAAYPEFSMFGELPAWGMYIRHVKGLTLKNVTLHNKKEDYRTALLVNESENIELNRVTIAGPVPSPKIIVNNTEGVLKRKTRYR